MTGPPTGTVPRGSASRSSTGSFMDASPAPAPAPGGTGSGVPMGPVLLSRAALAVVPVLGTVTCLIATRHGAVVSQDSAVYLGAAHNLLAGRGATTPFELSGSALTPGQAYAFHGAVPLVHFPPLFPLVLAVLTWTGTSPVAGVRVLDAVLFGVSLLAFELLVRRFTASAVLVPVTATLLLLAGPAVFFHVNLLVLHAQVLSEPLFLAVFLVGLLLTVVLIERPTRWAYAGLIACVAIAPLVRYAGLAMVGAAAVVVWLWVPLPRRRRRLAAVVIAGCGLLPSLAWSVYVSGVLHGGSARTVAWHPPPGLGHWLLYIGSGWLLPGSVPDRAREPAFVAIVVLGALALVASRLRRPDETRQAVRLVTVAAVFAAAYLAIVVITRAVLDPEMPLDNRILSPLIPLLYLFLVTTVVTAFQRPVVGRLAAAGLCLLAAAGAVVATVAFVRQAEPTPVPLGTTLTESPTMEAVRRLPPGTLIASSVGDLIYLDTGRASIRLPLRTPGDTGHPDPSFPTQVRELATLLAEHRGVLVDLPVTYPDAPLGIATTADIASVADLHLVRALADGGRIYRIGKIRASSG